MDFKIQDCCQARFRIAARLLEKIEDLGDRKAHPLVAVEAHFDDTLLEAIREKIELLARIHRVDLRDGIERSTANNMPPLVSKVIQGPPHVFEVSVVEKL